MIHITRSPGLSPRPSVFEIASQVGAAKLDSDAVGRRAGSAVMIVCQCRRITDRDVRAAMARGVGDLEGIARDCGAGTDCRGCHATLAALLEDRRSPAPPTPGARHRLTVIAA